MGISASSSPAGLPCFSRGRSGSGSAVPAPPPESSVCLLRCSVGRSGSVLAVPAPEPDAPESSPVLRCSVGRSGSALAEPEPVPEPDEAAGLLDPPELLPSSVSASLGCLRLRTGVSSSASPKPPFFRELELNAFSAFLDSGAVSGFQAPKPSHSPSSFQPRAGRTIQSACRLSATRIRCRRRPPEGRVRAGRSFRHSTARHRRRPQAPAGSPRASCGPGPLQHGHRAQHRLFLVVRFGDAAGVLRERSSSKCGGAGQNYGNSPHPRKRDDASAMTQIAPLGNNPKEHRRAQAAPSRIPTRYPQMRTSQWN